MSTSVTLHHYTIGGASEWSVTVVCGSGIWEGRRRRNEEKEGQERRTRLKDKIEGQDWRKDKKEGQDWRRRMKEEKEGGEGTNQLRVLLPKLSDVVGLWRTFEYLVCRCCEEVQSSMVNGLMLKGLRVLRAITACTLHKYTWRMDTSRNMEF